MYYLIVFRLNVIFCGYSVGVSFDVVPELGCLALKSPPIR